MTDKELKAKILAEIEKKIKVLSPFTHQGSDTCGKVIRQLESLVSFINSIPEEPVSEDLEKFIEKSMPSKYCWSGDGETTLYTREQMVAFCKDGARWKEQQIMKTAVGACVCSVYPLKLYNEVHYSVKYPLGVLPHKDGDKVKVIIIKEE